jgi:hypothetical protein
MFDLKTPHVVKSHAPAVITIRIQMDLHQRTKDAAWRHRVSMNQFIIAAIEEALRQCAEAEAAENAAKGIPEHWQTNAGMYVDFVNDSMGGGNAQANQ